MKKMRKHAIALSLMALGQAPFSSPGFTQALAEPKEAAQFAPGAIEEITVTANKRDESILDVAGAISAFRGVDMLDDGVTSIADLAGRVPGLQFNASYGTGAPVIRGINMGADFGQAVGITVDGAPVGPSSSFQPGGAASLDLDPIDLERVEVLKGPQGTVYGANTLAGLISYTLRKPDLEETTAIARLGLNATKSGGVGHSERAAISVPILEDRLAVRVSGFNDRRAGFIDNHLTNDDDQNDWKSKGVQGSVAFEPTDRLSLFVAGFYQRQNQNAQDRVIYTENRNPRDGDLVYNDYLVPSTDRKTRFVVANIEYDFDFASLTSVSSYQHLNVDYDIPTNTGTLHSVIVDVLPMLGGVTIPEPGLLSNNTRNDFEKFTQELRLTSLDSSSISWIAGAYYTDEKSEQQQAVNARTTSGSLVPLINPTLLITVPTTLSEYSVFGNLTYAFSPELDITGGYRIGRIDQVNRTTFGGTDATAYSQLFVVSGLGSGPPADTGDQKGSSTVETYLATVRYSFSDDGMVFARFATGYRPGGPNFPVPGLDPVYEADQTYNYELGVKSAFWNRRGSVDVTGYYLQWKDFLAFTSAGGLNGFDNAGDARVHGAEAALTLQPIDGLTLSGAVAYSDSKVTKADPLTGVAAIGDTLPYNPRWSGSLAVEYRAPVNPVWQTVARASARFVGQRNSSPQSSVTFPNYELPSYSLFDAHIGMESEFMDIGLFIRNISDERAELAAFTQLGINQITIQQPRTIGATVTFKY